MGFDDLLNDEMIIERTDGSRSGPHKCGFSSDPDSVRVFDVQLLVAEQDHVLRILPNGTVERYLVTSADFSSGMPPHIPASYQLKLRKSTAIPPQPHVAKHTTVNIHQSTGVQVGDHNVVNIQHALTQLLAQVEQAPAPAEDKTEVKNRLAALLAHPLVVSIVGGLAGGAAGLVSK
ncbi:RIP homotypic interaction motif-containing protein [Massilia horti]|uniref:Uncharacterized protein n=1 Tax=Massilia horti TaxID=2562153 RepID=A0A4Y9T949_9BURK|nr:RIP homotypic interaction motif-containing protein [Massilia horti]TFW34638.1 hypothetical protein E4O92_03500 [Massilia horti]